MVSAFGLTACIIVVLLLWPGVRVTEAFTVNQLRNFELSLHKWYTASVRIKCPFFRRRATDAIDNLVSVTHFILARHKSLPISDLLPVPPSCLPDQSNPFKTRHLEIDAVQAIIERDWMGTDKHGKAANGKGYYINGKLTKEIYRSDSAF